MKAVSPADDCAEFSQELWPAWVPTACMLLPSTNATEQQGKKAPYILYQVLHLSECEGMAMMRMSRVYGICTVV